VYALQLESLEKWVMAERQTCATLAAAGAKVQIPTLADARVRFDDALCAPLKAEAIDPEREELLVALGLRRD